MRMREDLKIRFGWVKRTANRLAHVVAKKGLLPRDWVVIPPNFVSSVLARDLLPFVSGEGWTGNWICQDLGNVGVRRDDILEPGDVPMLSFIGDGQETRDIVVFWPRECSEMTERLGARRVSIYNDKH
ncbi:hypothetical protein RHSIM_Rhsim12G0181100 [Rhododendron simsii]|uniref:Uncharacterized protein n=1 Tax=Rhododendron simsii TaxID=118357 RepID=A0A834L8K1_RHOSS|nr:hypothetical protein RHSIM_Rhsim12G0181100 [Rhododendron simsii]